MTTNGQLHGETLISDIGLKLRAIVKRKNRFSNYIPVTILLELIAIL